ILSTKNQDQLKCVEKVNVEKAMTTNNGVKISEEENILTVGERGPSLLEDFHFREKIMHFAHQCIAERVVHASGFESHGEFQVYKDLSEYTSADFLTHPE